MAQVVLFALLLSVAIYTLIGIRFRKSVKGLADVLPIVRGKMARVDTKGELSASNVAASISLATVIVAFFDLSPTLGLWLIWPALTTALGFWLFSKLGPVIWARLSVYNHRPSLHEFIGTEFSSGKLAVVAAIFTTIGYLSAFAVELTVGTRFLAALLPSIPEWISITLLVLVGLFYTTLGGFRTVVITDVYMMRFIWLLLCALLAYYSVSIFGSTEKLGLLNKIPVQSRTIWWNNSLIPFVCGILIMNLFTYVSNMGLWQRIAGTTSRNAFISGMKETVLKSVLSWTLFAVVAIGALAITKPEPNTNLLITLLQNLSQDFIGKITLFCVVLGLYGAMLSTASTQLIALSHTIYEDILAPKRKLTLENRLNSRKELLYARTVLLFSAVGAIGIVELLQATGFSIADLAFSIYGAALGLVPPILLALNAERAQLAQIKSYALGGICLGFFAAWAVAFYGKFSYNGNLVFWAPVVGLIASSSVVLIGLLSKKENKGSLFVTLKKY